MIRKKLILNGLYLVIALIAFSLSFFKTDNQVWIAAWIAPVLLIRFMRTNKWVFAVVLGFIVLLIADVIALIPVLTATGDIMENMDIMIMLSDSAKEGTLLIIPLFLVPFILDKALYKQLPKFASTLLFPSAIVTFELFYSFTIGTLYSFGQSQFAIQPLVMIASLIGIFGLSFVITWSASMINYLWEEEWDIKKLGFSGLVYIVIMTVLLIYGAVEIVFPKKANAIAPIAGITLDTNFDKRIFYDFNIILNPDINPAEYAKRMSSPESDIQEMRQKTLDAVKAGSKIIVWQEYALTLESSAADNFLLEMKDLADREDIYLLVSYGRILYEKEKQDRIMKNIGILFTPEGNIGWEYEKAFPVTEMEDLIIKAGPRDIPYVDTPYGRIGQVICFDMHFPHYLRQAAAKKIDLLFVPSYDSPAFTPLHTFNGGFRAVEYGFTMVRITGDGHSGVIDPYYRLWSSQDTFEQGSTNYYYNVPVISTKTIYGIIGFIIPYIIVLLLILLILVASIKEVQMRSKGEMFYKKINEKGGNNK